MVVASQGSRLLLTVFLLVVGILVAGLAYFQRVTATGKVDCAYSSWKTAHYGSCSSVCHGVQFATVSVVREATNGGKECDPIDAIRSQSCNTEVDCNQSCIAGDPSRIPWTACPTCLGDNIFPVQWKIIPPLQPATNGGTDCRLEEVLQTRPCEGFIPACPPSVDCVMVPYYTSSCNVTCGSGTKNVLQSVTVFPEGDGSPCNPAFLSLQESCFVDCSCIPFEGSFTTCNAACGQGIQARYQSGQPTGCSSIETQSCMITQCENTSCFAPSVDYIQALCVLSCSGLPLPAFAEGVCSTSAMMTTICAASGAFNPCAEARDCSLSTWSTYSDCSIPQCSTARQDGGTRTAVRAIVSNAVGGGIQCIDEVMLITEPCNAWLPIPYEAYDTLTNSFTSSVSAAQCTASRDCEYSAFYSVSTCSAPCQGTGSITYFRSITQFPDSPFSGRQCDTSPGNLTSYSLCTNATACTPCVWYSPTDDPSFLFQCQYTDSGWKSEYVSLASNSNNTDCFTTGSTCTFDQFTKTVGTITYPPGKDANGNYRTETCKAYGTVCSGFSQCPAPQNLVCNGQGVPVDLNGTCTCECYERWSGNACDIHFGQLCPIGSNTQECSGVGACNIVTGSCTCPNGDLTSDCSAQALAWCWMFADYVMDPCTVSNFTWPLRKLMGAFPIIDSAYGSFSIENCTSSEWNDVDLSGVVLTVPAPLLQPDLPALDTCSMNSARFTTEIRPDPPATLFHDWRLYCDMTVDDAILNQNYPTEQFVHRLVPGSFPVRCESLFSQSFIANPNDIAQNTVQFETTNTSASAIAYSISQQVLGINVAPTYPNPNSAFYIVGVLDTQIDPSYTPLLGFQNSMAIVNNTGPPQSITVPISYLINVSEEATKLIPIPTDGCFAVSYPISSISLLFFLCDPLTSASISNISADYNTAFQGDITITTIKYL